MGLINYVLPAICCTKNINQQRQYKLVGRGRHCNPNLNDIFAPQIQAVNNPLRIQITPTLKHFEACTDVPNCWKWTWKTFAETVGQTFSIHKLTEEKMSFDRFRSPRICNLKSSHYAIHISKISNIQQRFKQNYCTTIFLHGITQ